MSPSPRTRKLLHPKLGRRPLQDWKMNFQTFLLCLLHLALGTILKRRPLRTRWMLWFCLHFLRIPKLVNIVAKFFKLIFTPLFMLWLLDQWGGRRLKAMLMLKSLLTWSGTTLRARAHGITIPCVNGRRWSKKLRGEVKRSMLAKSSKFVLRKGVNFKKKPSSQIQGEDCVPREQR